MPATDWQLEYEQAMVAAQEAAKVIIALAGFTGQVAQKPHDAGPVTEADMASDAVIKKILQPFGYPIISEESGDNTILSDTPTTWIIDPLDGTKDFIAGSPEYAIHIGLVHEGVPVVGVVYQPATGIYYAARRGHGAYKINGSIAKPLHVIPTATLAGSRAIMSRHHFTAAEKKILEQSHIPYVQHGSCGLKMSAVASGQAEIYFTFGPIKYWDVCAPQCIVTQSGGRVTDSCGQEIDYGKRIPQISGLLVTNGRLHDSMVQLIKTQDYA